MIGWLRRTLSFSRFTVKEYVRSGRVLVEIMALVIGLWLFFLPQIKDGLDATYFFGVAGLLIPALAAVTTVLIMRLGNRPQGYVVLGRRLGRAGYLFGLYLSATFITLLSYALLLLVVLVGSRLINPVVISPVTWAQGTLPLMLNAGIVAAFVMILMPLLLPDWMRLLVLVSFLAVGVSGLSKEYGLFESSNLGGLLERAADLLAIAITPVARGYMLATSHAYDSLAVETLLIQLGMVLILLGLALMMFCRREIIFRS